MIIDIITAMGLDGMDGADPLDVEFRILAVEDAIRRYTNNDFNVRGVRVTCPSTLGKLAIGENIFFIGDHVEIKNGINAGLYDVVDVNPTTGLIELDKPLRDAEANVINLVEYPPSVVAGACNMLLWDYHGRDTQGVASETISRHSVSYHQYGEAEMVEGYPAHIMAFVRPFIKARF